MIVFCLSFNLSHHVQAQVDYLLQHFTLNQVENKVLILWEISAGNTCNGIEIQRSSDGNVYEQIGFIGGICGSPDLSVAYQYIDSFPLKNQVSYYRLNLGGIGESGPRSITYFDREGGFLIAPNPGNGIFNVWLENPFQEESIIQIFSVEGMLVSSITSRASDMMLDLSSIPGGLYLIQVYIPSRNVSVQRKFVVF